MKNTLSLRHLALGLLFSYAPLSTHAAHLGSAEVPPSTHELACLSSCAYSDNIPADRVVRNHQNRYPYELGDWEIVERFKIDRGLWGGYRGVLCYNKDKNQVVLAHRGTKPSNLNSLQTDFLAITLGWTEGQSADIDDFIRTSVAHAHEKKAFLYITGHSLGGWLAQVTMCILQSRMAGEQAVQQVRPRTHCITFDTPGASVALKYFSKKYASCSQDISQQHIVNYLSAPNPVNTCRQHIGGCYRVVFNEPLGQLVNLPTHSLDHFIGLYTHGLHHVPPVGVDMGDESVASVSFFFP